MSDSDVLDTNGITNPTATSTKNAPTAYVITNNLTSVVVDGLYPTVSSHAAPANGTYESGDSISFPVTYREAVTVTGTTTLTFT